jgi:hypothetical protein
MSCIGVYVHKYVVFQVLAVFQEIGVNQVLYFLVFGESLLNGMHQIEIERDWIGGSRQYGERLRGGLPFQSFLVSRLYSLS